MDQNKNHTEFTYRQFGLSNWALNNRKVVMVLTFIIFFWGVYTYNTVPKESFPEIVVPTIYVGTAYPGNSGEDIEKLITKQLEKEINTITDIDKMTSSSVQGYSAINIEFDFSITAEDALRKVKDAVDKAMSDPDFPKDLPAEPNIFEMNFTELMPIMNINLSGDYSLEDLKDYAERLEDELEKIPQINKVEIKGLSEKEVRVEINNFALEARQLSFNDIADALRSQNTTVSAGDIRMGDMNRSVKVSGEFKNMITNTTSTIPKKMLFSRSLTCMRVKPVWSLVMVSVRLEGRKSSCASSIAALMASLASSKFSPPRLITSRLTTGFLNSRA